ncbi:ATP-grasp domain-containing protein [Providencia rettgeri]|nr:ATP-grasp domain-containing protein [Providencia rettgeri]QPE17762.1 ATP-grasp domain-containing protein [Providencia rettgeri]
MSNKCVLIVDPFSSGATFVGRVKKYFGYDVIALITNNELPAVILNSFKEEDYSFVFYSTSHDDAARQIELYLGRAPDFIVCGSEPGVLIFDQLSNRWNLLPNIFKLSQTRRNKCLMQNRLKLDGIRYIPHYRARKLINMLAWCDENNFAEYVVKPIYSFGTDGVFFCKDKKEVEKAFNLLINTYDYSGNKNNELLIEQKIEGIEYVVDAVTSNGVHFIVNIFRYIKQEVQGVPIYHQMVTEPIEEHLELVNYTKSILTSLGICNGTSHNEIILSSEGPVLVESGARMHGGLGPTIVERCNTHSLIDLSLIVRIDPAKFIEKTRIPPTLHCYGIEYFLSSTNAGYVKEINIENLCGPLESYGLTVCKLKTKDYLEKTVDLITSYGRIVFFNNDREILSSDVKTVVDLEKTGKLITFM